MNELDDILAAREKLTEAEQKALDNQVDQVSRDRMSGSRESLLRLFGVETRNSPDKHSG